MSSSSNHRDNLVPIKTQLNKPPAMVSWSQYQNTKPPPLIVVYTPEKLTPCQVELMKKCQTLLEYSVHHTLVRLIRHVDQIKTFSPEQTNLYFIIPEEENNVIRKIRERFGNRGKIYLPRAVIGALSHYNIQLPSKSFSVSLSMHDCRVFLSIGYKVHSREEERRKDMERQQIGRRILEMGGVVVPKWEGQEAINVVVTDNASSKYGILASKEKIPVVSRNWVDDTYECEKNLDYTGEEEHFNAMNTIDQYRIRPFYGLHFKITLSDERLQKEAKNLIIENQGQVVYGNEDSLTHIVRQDKDIKTQQLQTYQSQGKENLHFVGLNWLRMCAHEGRCIALKEFKSMTKQIKREQVSPEPNSITTAITDASFTSSFDGGSYDLDLTPPLPELHANDENCFMPPPPMPPPTSLPKNKQQQQQAPDSSMSDDMILKSLFTDQQTVHVSTQIRCLPDPELQIEQICEPSQQLFWNDARNG